MELKRILIKNEEEFDMMLLVIKDSIKIAIDTENGNRKNIDRSALNPTFAIPAGISLSIDGKVGYYIPVNHTDYKEVIPRKRLNEILINKKLIIMHNCVYDAAIFKAQYNIDLTHDYIFYDTMIAQHLLDEYNPKGLKVLTKRYFGIKQDEFQWKDMCEAKAVDIYKYACDDAIYTYLHYLRTKEQIKSQQLVNLMMKIEMPFQRCLIHMKLNGIYFDEEKAKELEKDLLKDKDKLVKEIISVTPEIPFTNDLFGGKVMTIKLDSNQHLTELLFDRLNLIPMKNTPTGKPAVDKEALKLLKDDFDEWQHPIVPLLLKYSGIQKLLNTYTHSLYTKVINHRIYTDFKDHGTVSGRMSSSCIDGNTLIDTKKSKIKLKDLCTKKQPKTHIIKTSKGFYKGLVYYSGKKECIKFGFKNSDLNLVCTKEHRIQHHRNKFIPAGDINIGKRLFNYDLNEYLIINSIEDVGTKDTYDITIIEDEQKKCIRCNKIYNINQYKMKNQNGIVISSVCKNCRYRKAAEVMKNLHKKGILGSIDQRKRLSEKQKINNTGRFRKNFNYSEQSKKLMSESRLKFINKEDKNYICPYTGDLITYKQYNKKIQKFTHNTKEYKLKVSNALKNYYKNADKDKLFKQRFIQVSNRNNCKNHKGLGKHGKFYSKKNNKTFYYKSLLERDFMMLLENDNNIIAYEYEYYSIPFKDLNKIYTPDFSFITKDFKEYLIELKSIYIYERFGFDKEILKKLEKMKNFKLIITNEIDFTVEDIKKW